MQKLAVINMVHTLYLYTHIGPDVEGLKMSRVHICMFWAQIPHTYFQLLVLVDYLGFWVGPIKGYTTKFSPGLIWLHGLLGKPGSAQRYGRVIVIMMVFIPTEV